MGRARAGALAAMLTMSLAGIASADPEPHLLSIVPAGFECFAGLDARAVAAWPLAAQVLEQFPKDKKELEQGGVWPIRDIDSVVWAMHGTGKDGIDGVTLIRGKVDMERLRAWMRSDATKSSLQRTWTIRGPQLNAIELAPRLVIVGAPSLIQYAKTTLHDHSAGIPPKSALSDHERETRALFDTLSATGGYRLACRPNERSKTQLRKKWSEASAMLTMVVEVKLGDGLDLSGRVKFATDAEAAAMLKSLHARVASFRGSAIARIGRLEPFFLPIQLRQAGSTVEFHYPMDRGLVSRALAAMRAIRDLQQSSGDVVR